MKKYQNYHCHKDGSNIFTADSATKYKNYAERAIELGHKTLSTMEHGYQGRYFEAYAVAKEYGLKFLYSTEAYWVKNRFEKDATNSHICILAKNDKGRKAINLALSEANETGYYFKPRLDLELILGLPKDDVFITTACVAFWRYEDIEEIVAKFKQHFGKNFMLEVQYQPFDMQYDVNKRILHLSKKYDIELIAGMDSHYIHPSQKIERDEVLLSKGIRYDNEDEFHMDYPNYDTAFARFKKQGILTDAQIEKALDNTNIVLEFGDYDNVEIFNSDIIKLPSLYPNATQKEKNDKLKKIILRKWKEEKLKKPKDMWATYQNEIKKELKSVFDTNMTDYFLIDYEIVKTGVKKGGIISSSGRGSAVSFYINNLLGFTKIDRISAKVKMFPERFMSKSRILETRSLPDIDLNLGNPEIFAEAQSEILGENHSYPMIAYGTFKIKSAFKMYAKAKNVDFEIANQISSQIEKYEKDLSYAEEDEKDTIDIYDYIEEKYHKVFDDSKKYQGIISDKKAHACGYLIYDKNIKEEIGLIKVKTESTKKEVIVCLLDGKSADKFKFLKNDLLKVDVAKTNFLIAQKMGIELPSQDELIQLTKDDKKVWDIYEKGLTVGVNQVEKDSTTKKAMRYAPKNIEELCAFIAGIRPSFKSMYPIFEKREHFSYDIASFDKIIRNTGVDESFIIYQETIMAVLSFSGFEDDETYSIVKAISKKTASVFKDIKPKFIKNISDKFMRLDGLSKEDAKKEADSVWKIIEDSSSYCFNASHSYCMAYDSLLGAFFKSKIYDFYEVQMQEYDKKKNKDKIAKFKNEIINFGVELSELKFGNDNRGFVADREKNIMNQPLSAIKYMNKELSQGLYNLGNDIRKTDFLDILSKIKTLKILDKRQLEILIKLDYFEDFGKSRFLLNVVDIYDKIIDRKTIKKTDISKFGISKEHIIKNSTKETPKTYSELDNMGIIEDAIENFENKDISLVEKIKAEIEYLGYIKYKNSSLPETIYYVKELTQYGNKNQAYLNLYNVSSGETIRAKIKKEFSYNKFASEDIIRVTDMKKEAKKIKDANGQWVDKKGEYWNIISHWTILSKGK